MSVKLTPTSKALLIAVPLALAAYFFWGNIKSVFGGKSEAKTEQTDSKSNGLLNLFKGGDDLTIAVNTWGGFAPLAYLNNGSLEPDENSIIYKKYGIKLHIKIINAFTESRNTFINDEADVVYCTADALPIDMGYSSSMTKANSEIFAQVDWSRGGDMIVVRKGIKTVADLKGKTIAVAVGTASHTFLIKLLDANGLTMEDVTIIKVNDGIEAATAYKSNRCDAAVIWTPDDGDCLAKISGTKVLVGTETATYIIADGLVAKKSYIEKNNELLVKLTTAWLEANSEINTKADVKEKAAQAFAKAFEVDIDFARNGIEKVRLTTLGDNMNFFGLNSTYSGVTGEQLYTRMSMIYSDLGLTSNPLPWRNVSNTSVIEKVKLSGAANDAEKREDFTPVTVEVKSREAISSKKVTINFESGSYFLDDDAKAIIDREFGTTLKDFGNARVRVEGNCDATGSNSVNQPLSEKRAKSVADYLIKEYRLDPDKFIIIGNGSSKAIEAGVTGASEAYRKTDFQIIPN